MVLNDSFNGVADVASSLPLPAHTEKSIPYLITFLVIVGLTYFVTNHGSKIPEINPLQGFELTNSRRITHFVQNSRQLMTKGREEFKGRLWRMYSDWGDVIVVPPEVVNELRSDPRVELQETATDDTHGYIPGFDPFDTDPVMPMVVTKYLTRALTKLTQPLSEEAALVLREKLTDSPDWHEIAPGSELLPIIARLSTRVFMGTELCRDANWVHACSQYTAKSFAASFDLCHTPRWARPITHWFRSDCWQVRAALKECRRVLRPFLERREQRRQEAISNGAKGMIFDDSIEWFQKESKRRIDPATIQITLSNVAIHTTTDLLQQVMIDLAHKPELFEPLRQEVISVLSAEGLKKTALYNLKLMDSVLKESQRLKPVMFAPWRRRVLADIELENGMSLKKGQKLVCTTIHMWDPEYYENPLEYDGYRFLNMRGTEEEKGAHLVSSTVKHIGFGHGQHSCPGRFFAANELKIALAHLLLKYEWKLPEGSDPRPIAYGMIYLPDPSARLLIRRRKEELDFDSLEC